MDTDFPKEVKEQYRHILELMKQEDTESSLPKTNQKPPSKLAPNHTH